MRIAAQYSCQIWIPEIEYYQKVSSHAQIWPQGAEKLLRKVRVVGGCTVWKPILLWLIFSFSFSWEHEPLPELVNFKQNLFYYYSFSTVYFLCSTDYYQYYQNITNDNIIKLYEKFLPDFLAFGYTLDGFLNKDYST